MHQLFMLLEAGIQCWIDLTMTLDKNHSHQLINCNDARRIEGLNVIYLSGVTCLGKRVDPNAGEQGDRIKRTMGFFNKPK